MSVGLFQFDKDDVYDRTAKLIFSQNVSSESFYVKHWSRAVRDTDSKLFRDGSEFGIDDLNEVLIELIKQKEWAQKELHGDELGYMIFRIDELIERIPQACKENNRRFYIF